MLTSFTIYVHHVVRMISVHVVNIGRTRSTDEEGVIRPTYKVWVGKETLLEESTQDNKVLVEDYS
jgi:hypothetical protein